MEGKKSQISKKKVQIIGKVKKKKHERKKKNELEKKKKKKGSLEIYNMVVDNVIYLGKK